MNGLMAFSAIARQLQRINIRLSSSPLPISFSKSPISFQFYSASHRICFTYPPSLRQTITFSTFRTSNDSTIHVAFDFNTQLDLPLENYQLNVRKLVDAIKNAADSFSSEEETSSFLDETCLEPNEGLIYSLICALKDDWKLTYWIFMWGKKKGFAGEKIGALMVWILGTNKKFNTAWCLIRDLHSSSVDTHPAMHAMIDRYAASNDPNGAIQAFNFMEKFKLSPDMESLQALLITLCKHGNIEEAEEFMFLNKKLFPLETKSFNIILNGWCNISVDVYEAKRIWREMSKSCILPNGDSYQHMISCFSKVGNLFDSLRLYDEMRKRGFIPNLNVYNSLIHVLTRENCLNDALKLLDKMKETGLQPDSITLNAFICPLCELSKMEDAKNVLARMKTENVAPTVSTYHAFLKEANVEGTLEILNCMVKSSLRPNRETFLLIFKKFFEMKQAADALKIWVEMKQYNVSPDSAHYNIVVGGLVNSGFKMKAKELYAEMKYNEFVLDPKVMKLLNEPVRTESSQKRREPVRNVCRDNIEVYDKRKAMERKKKFDGQSTTHKGILSIFDRI
ncbi:pentatricopeptide repeat-containing protein At1g80880, mitochondrial [Impatiens glandulifera]|uniref:pentatricopeptide repeat-containing protein At1g80880, mitochondrial n=1 Tax=Impatiens glandulifera TaxID=253017 RepID=UPI001FB0EE21|nr:pentatricopeptide repeat-containing protein At1g80880, mitochondrial [Impatiens glandulifera]